MLADAPPLDDFDLYDDLKAVLPGYLTDTTMSYVGRKWKPYIQVNQRVRRAHQSPAMPAPYPVASSMCEKPTPC